MNKITSVSPGNFEPENHWYPKALNATIHPMVSFFFSLSKERIANRYCHLRPTVSPDHLLELLSYKPRYFLWAGADLFNVTTEHGKRQMVVIENNSCPSGQKSMPVVNDHDDYGGYRPLMENSFKAAMKSRRLPKGALAVIYDKNPMEASGYAAAMADVFQESVYLIPYYKDEVGQQVRSTDGQLEFLDEDGAWKPLRAVFRYLTQKPWNRLPVNQKTFIYNPVVACLAGGRNKMIAAKAYDLFNGELAGSGLRIMTPETIWDLAQNEVPLWVSKMGGQAVVKNPYSNAGQGVYTIVNQDELDAFMEMEFEYDLFIVQSLIGNFNWSSTTSSGKFYHVGTLPNRRGETFAADLRMMICGTAEGFRPLSIYSRRARMPLSNQLDTGLDSWAMLGTNLSIKKEDGQWDSDTNRLMLMDRKDFNRIGVSLDDMIEGYVQTILSTIAIDKMARNLFNAKGKFRKKLFQSLNNDPALLHEILIG